MKILAVSDEVIERLYNLCASGQFKEVELIAGCGDLPYTYLENIVSMLNVPLFYVPGNHDPAFSPTNPLAHAEGGSNIDLKLVRHKRFLIGGFGGSIRYRPDGVNQYSQAEAYFRAWRLLPALLVNRVKFGRALDLLITHSPPYGIHAINWLLQIAKPRYHLHGHTHFQRRNLSPSETRRGLTTIMNIFPYKIVEVNH